MTPTHEDRRSKVAVVTGASNGIGKAIADLFWTNDWEVISIDKKRRDTIGSFIECDISSAANCQSACEEIGAGHHAIHALINNAAIQIAAPLTELTVQDWDETFAINVRAPFLFTKLLSTQLRKVSGCVINISSVHATATSTGMSAYAASKGALSAFTRSCALEFASSGVRVISIAPGAIKTNMLEESAIRFGSDYPTFLKNLQSGIPIGRVGEPKEVAELAFHLCDPSRSSLITGQEIVIDGGVLVQLGSETST